MIKFGIIGTSWISRGLLDAANIIEDVQFTNLYSRTQAKAEEFLVEDENVEIDTDLTSFFARDFDFVYIASPNTLHFSQAKMALENGKHVFLEKPFTTKLEDAKILFEIAAEKNLLILEAISSLAKPNLMKAKVVLNDMKFGNVKEVTFSFCQYSSKLSDLEKGIIANSLNHEFGGGATNDLGVYPIHMTLDLFGTPKEVKLNKTWTNGLELDAEIELIYENFSAKGRVSKSFDEEQHFIIKSKDNIIDIERIGRVEKVSYNGMNISDDTQIKVNMFYELNEFVDCLKAKKTNSQIMTKLQTLNVMKIIETEQGVKF